MRVFRYDNRIEPTKFKKKLNREARIGDIYLGSGGYCSIKIRGGWEKIKRDNIPLFEKIYGKAKNVELFKRVSNKDNVLIRKR